MADTDVSEPYVQLEGAAAPSATPTRRPSRSDSLIRAASATFTRATSIVGANEARSRRALQRQTTARNMLQTSMERFHCGMLIFRAVFPILVIGIVGTMVYLFVNALIANYNYWSYPCDQPLDFYLLVSVVVGQVSSVVGKSITSRIERSDIRRRYFLILFTTMPGWLIIMWGVYMVMSSTTCARTNPGLYGPMAKLIFAQVLMGFFAFVMNFIGHQAILFLASLANQFSEGVGCEKAVHDLPKVPHDADELRDPEDGSVIECPICTVSLAQGSVVRTRCSHHFHEACLARWCQHHLLCPMCRAEIGEEEGDSRDMPQEREFV